MVVYTTDGGMAANNTSDPRRCIVPANEKKYGAWVLDDPANDPDSPDFGATDASERSELVRAVAAPWGVPEQQRLCGWACGIDATFPVVLRKYALAQTAARLLI